MCVVWGKKGKGWVDMDIYSLTDGSMNAWAPYLMSLIILFLFHFVDPTSFWRQRFSLAGNINVSIGLDI